jgi:predicted RNase H-like HicB family nuclease
MKIEVVIHPAAEGGYWAEVPAMSGCITEGETIEEVIANLKDAIAGWLEVESSRYVKCSPSSRQKSIKVKIKSCIDKRQTTYEPPC